MGLLNFLRGQSPGTKQSKSRWKDPEERLAQLLEPHAAFLAVERSRLVRRKRNGGEDVDRWAKAVWLFFVMKVLRPLEKRERERLSDEWLRLGAAHGGSFVTMNDVVAPGGGVYRVIDRIARRAQQERSRALVGERKDVMTMSPVEFEHYCAAVLQQDGWDASTTAASGDQGCDVLAIKGGLRVVIQCKRFTKPVGNSAVQEVLGARILYRAHAAAVIATAGFTKGAKELATAGGVPLLYPSELPKLSEELDRPSIRSHWSVLTAP